MRDAICEILSKKALIVLSNSLWRAHNPEGQTSLAIEGTECSPLAVLVSALQGQQNTYQTGCFSLHVLKKKTKQKRSPHVTGFCKTPSSFLWAITVPQQTNPLNEEGDSIVH